MCAILWPWPAFRDSFRGKWRFSRGAKCVEKWRLFERPPLSLTDLAFFAKISGNLAGEKNSGRCVRARRSTLSRQDWFLSDSQANTLIGLSVAVGLEVARAAYKELESIKEAQRSRCNSKRFQHGTLGVKYENVKF